MSVQVCYTLLCNHPSSGVTIEIDSDEGIIDLTEGQIHFILPYVDGFSYASIPLRVRTLTFSEYAAQGLDLTDDFDAEDIPITAADSN